MTPALQAALADLNPGQREAVLHQTSPLLILAGAGSGKTRVVTVKIAYLIDELGVDPRSILAVTFTNKAAGEMRERAAALVEDAAEVTIRTFHSFGAWMLRRNADAAGLPRDFSIYDDDDVVTLLHALYPEHKRATMARYSRVISRAKDYCLPADRSDDSPGTLDLSDISDDPQFPEIYRAYQERLTEIGNVDFGDLIMKPVRLLESEPAVARRMRDRFRYILVDEYQDSNVAQFRLLLSLSGPDSFVCVVGDDDQSIYRFRGAEVSNILNFPDIFPATRVVRLEQNYRSSAPILELAGAVVANNPDRLGKNLFTERSGGELPRLMLLPDQDDEVSWVIDRVRQAERAREEGVTAVLYRTNAQSRAFETALLREGIPYRIVGSVRFYEREEVKDALAFLRFVANPRDEVSFRRVINKPPRGIGARSLEKILEQRLYAAGNLLTAAEYALRDLSKKAGAGVEQFVHLVTSLAGLVESGESGGGPGDTSATLAGIVSRIIEESGLSRFHSEQDEIKGSRKIENLEELVNAAAQYPGTREGMVEFLEGIELDSAREELSTEDARVVLITMHNTKGLEFERVVITGLEEGLFPRNDDPLEIQEERRLFYVAITRARHEVTLISCRTRRIHGKFTDLLPSRFLGEIPRELIETESDDFRYPYGSSRGGDPDHEWVPGTTVYHDSYGTGQIVRAWFSGAELCVEARFETGMTGQFLPEYTPALERIAGTDDDWDGGW